MKEFIFVLFLLLLTSCQPVPSTIAPPRIDGFEFNDNCPHMCWLGINPGTTTEAELRKMLSDPARFRETMPLVDKAGIQIVWFSGEGKSNPVMMTIRLINGAVGQISFFNMTRYSLQDFLNTLGEPKSISIRYAPGDAIYIEYAIYYPSQKMMIWNTSSTGHGPEPEDTIEYLMLNIEMNDDNIPRQLSDLNKSQQPWLGYGHLNDYLPGQQVP